LKREGCGCERLSMGVSVNRLGLIKESFKAVTCVGDVRNEREFDPVGSMERLRIFVEMLGKPRAELRRHKNACPRCPDILD